MKHKILENLGTVFGDHRHNVARFNVRVPGGTHIIEFTINDSDEKYWNLANFPPSGPPDSFELVDTDENTFWLVESEADDAEAAREELQELLTSTGGEHAQVCGTETFYTPEIGSWKDWVSEAKDAIQGGFF